MPAPAAAIWGSAVLGWHLAALVVVTAAVAALEAMLFGFLGNIIDWLATVAPAQLWQREGGKLLALALLGGSLVCSAAWLVGSESGLRVLCQALEQSSGGRLQIEDAGGRVLGVTATAPTLDEAIRKAYADVKKILFDKAHYRTDIGVK